MINLKEEISAMRELKQSNKSLRLYAIFEDSINIYLLMEYMRGGDLKSYMRNLNRALNEVEVKSFGF